jgi:hypothetical protein
LDGDWLLNIKIISIYYIDMSGYEPPLKDVSIFDKNDFLKKSTLLTQNNSPVFVKFPKAQGDVILRNVEANNIQVDGDVLMNSLRTPDKIVNSWVSRSTNDNDWAGITWSPQLGIFCAVGFSGTNNRAMISSDGINWATQFTSVDTGWASVTWAAECDNGIGGQGLFCAVNATSTTTNTRVMTSPDGVTWTARNTLNRIWADICWAAECPNGIGGEGLFCAVARTQTGNRVKTSPDGVTWTFRSPTDRDWFGVCWSPQLGIFCAVASSGSGDRVMTSQDGVSWVLRNSAADINWRSVCWSPELGLFCAVAASGSNDRVMISPDGVNWSLQSSPNNNEWRSVCWSPELRVFCAVAFAGEGDRIMTSPNGINWTLHSAPTTNPFRGLTWSPELYMFAAVSQQGSNDRVITTREASKPLLSNTSKQVESTTQPLTIMNPLSGTTSNIQEQLNNHPYVYDDIQTIQTQPKLLFGVVTSSNSAVVSVVFDPPFDTTPIVQIVINSNTVAVPLVSNRTATGFDFESVNSSGSKLTQTYNWLAIGV